jgi:hypothetical protein
MQQDGRLGVANEKIQEAERLRVGAEGGQPIGDFTFPPAIGGEEIDPQAVGRGIR